MPERITITIKDAAITAVDARTERGEPNRSGVISRDLERYYESIIDARATLRKKLSKQEIAAIIDNLNGVRLTEMFSLKVMWANVEDSLKGGLAEKWQIDGPTLVEKLRALSIIEYCALADAAERFGDRSGKGEDVKIEDALEG